MSSRRMIASDIWRDEFVGGLDLLGRVLWVGLITTCADDQGRLMNNPKLIRSDVFPLDDIPIIDIATRLDAFAQSGKTAVYEAEGKSLIQIINWWEYQTPSWASASKFPPPPGWIDREKYHTVGNNIATKNWNTQGGYVKVGSPLPSTLPSGIEEGDVKGDVKGEDDVKGEGEDAPLTPEIVQRWLEKYTGLPPAGKAGLDAIDDLVEAQVTSADVENGCQWYRDNTRGGVIRYYSSVVGPIKTAKAKRAQQSLPTHSPAPSIDPRKAALQALKEQALREEAANGITQ